jgi:hypothetical protein
MPRDGLEAGRDGMSVGDGPAHAWHALPAVRVAGRLAADLEAGLTDDEIRRRLARVGPRSASSSGCRQSASGDSRVHAIEVSRAF